MGPWCYKTLVELRVGSQRDQMLMPVTWQKQTYPSMLTAFTKCYCWARGEVTLSWMGWLPDSQPPSSWEGWTQPRVANAVRCLLPIERCAYLLEWTPGPFFNGKDGYWRSLSFFHCLWLFCFVEASNFVFRYVSDDLLFLLCNPVLPCPPTSQPNLQPQLGTRTSFLSASKQYGVGDPLGPHRVNNTQSTVLVYLSCNGIHHLLKSLPFFISDKCSQLTCSDAMANLRWHESQLQSTAFQIRIFQLFPVCDKTPALLKRKCHKCQDFPKGWEFQLLVSCCCSKEVVVRMRKSKKACHLYFTMLWHVLLFQRQCLTDCSVSFSDQIFHTSLQTKRSPLPKELALCGHHSLPKLLEVS